ncbi:MAG: FAD-dependent thymidylate synthase [Chloroflexota bacterium]|nr:MAG: FAD-dependent thymidylate synthase [Chloroflexota bacterium]
MRVTLIKHTPEPELLIASAARLCYSASGIEQIVQRMTPEEVDRMLDQLLSSGHLSPFEHASFSFGVEGISRAASHQLVRHRLASYSQQSQRYVSLRRLEYVVPPTIKERGALQQEYEAAMESVHRLYLRLLEEGVPAEDARFVLPNATATRLVMTMNARELMHTCSIRLCVRAQWEIREMFALVRAEVVRVAPRLGRELKIKCDRLGYCDERESCGLYPLKGEVLPGSA